MIDSGETHSSELIVGWNLLPFLWVVRIIFGHPRMLDLPISYLDGNYKVFELLLIGFLYCKFDNGDMHLKELWDIMNPNLAVHIDVEIIIKTIITLLYICID